MHCKRATRKQEMQRKKHHDAMTEQAACKMSAELHSSKRQHKKLTKCKHMGTRPPAGSGSLRLWKKMGSEVCEQAKSVATASKQSKRKTSRRQTMKKDMPVALCIEGKLQSAKQAREMSKDKSNSCSRKIESGHKTDQQDKHMKKTYSTSSACSCKQRSKLCTSHRWSFPPSLRKCWGIQKCSLVRQEASNEQLKKMQRNQEASQVQKSIQTIEHGLGRAKCKIMLQGNTNHTHKRKRQRHKRINKIHASQKHSASDEKRELSAKRQSHRLL